MIIKSFVKSFGFYKISILLLVICAVWIGQRYVRPYFNLQFSTYNYQYPAPGEDFIVGIEPHTDVIPEFVLNIIKLAFYDRSVVVDHLRAPHLLIRDKNARRGELLKCQRWNAPYITFSGESSTMDRKNYRRNAPPIVEFVSSTPQKIRELYFPFVVWDYKPFVRHKEGNKQRKFLAYIHSNCVPQREKLFAILKERNVEAEGLGKCSRTNDETVIPSRSVGWRSLDEVYANYNFGMAMENKQHPGYITEKIMCVFRGGAIPIYWGDSATVKKYFNDKAFIDVGAFKTLEDAADYIIAISQNETEIKRMQNESIFKDGKEPELFKVSRDPNHPLLKEAARFLRSAYFKAIVNDSAPPMSRDIDFE
ncbi:hypothetical protein EDM53_01375 [Rickettsiales endosymbiont of Peranema trichophorum]|uniref:glycosyltransferase family 10 domain-containing protein n=1 Tax=Rickettsiales endosymbiont of Peranema trichophorum TaxID=2486577 RepID=UPI001023BE03|nr:glycosyltransferase family 10 [Rickettsiales endosymbiont of Peranema trichophorum]RZI47523.1 hypothetical protein EDM53_01375 [Rickettsiales endosymbiont of Peranema trichophorum]